MQQTSLGSFFDESPEPDEQFKPKFLPRQTIVLTKEDLEILERG